ncbi:MAG: LpxD N-terminal domain-containing protein, partial [Ginsengibacter sp.]
MEFTAQQIAALIQGKIEGDPQVSVTSFGKLEEATAGQLAFLANPKYEDFIYTTKASVIIINNTLQLEKEISATLIRVPDACSSFAELLTEYAKMAQANLIGIQQPTYIHNTATIGENVFIGAFTYIGENVIVGNNAKIY